MTVRASIVTLFLVLLAAPACRTPASGRPAIDTNPKPTVMNGTIAGHVLTDGDAPVMSRLVRAVPLDGGEAYEATTNSAGTYTMKVRPGRYRLEVQLQEGERIVREPGETKINTSDLDPHRDFVISTSR